MATFLDCDVRDQEKFEGFICGLIYDRIDFL